MRAWVVGQAALALRSGQVAQEEVIACQPIDNLRWKQVRHSEKSHKG